MISLRDFASQYVICRPITRPYAKRLLWTANALEAFSGATEIKTTLTESVVNSFLSANSDKSPYTIRSYRSDIVSLWNAAADLGLVSAPILRRILLPKMPDLVIDCYTVDEARALADTAKLLVGRYSWGVRRRDYWNAAIRLAWDTGLRRGDVIAFSRDSIRPDNVVMVLQNKTKKKVPVKLRPSTANAIDVIGGPYPLRFASNINYFTRHFAKIVRASGVRRGTFKWLRRASGSYVDAQLPGTGYKHLGQSGQQVFDKHYDAKLNGRNLPMPPEL